MTNDIPPDSLERPIRIGVFGLEPDAVHFAEACVLHEQFEVVGFVAADVEIATEILPGCVVLDEASLVASTLDIAFVAGSTRDRISLARHLVEHSRLVLIAPFDVTANELGELQCEVTAGRSLSWWRGHRNRRSFAQARSVVESGEAGPVRTLRFIRHEMAAQALPECPKTDWNDALDDVGSDVLWELLQLIESPAKSVFGRLSFARPAFGESAEPVPDSDQITGFLAHIDFECGATALIELDLSAATNLETGWVLQAARGGFANGRQSRTVEDGEVYEVPVSAKPDNEFDRLVALLRGVDEANLTAECRTSIEREIAVRNLIDAIRTSHASGSIEQL